jgi:hypothetical protein
MNVVVHEAVGEALCAEPFERVGQQLEKSSAVDVVNERQGSSIAPNHDVIDCAGKQNPIFSGHARRIYKLRSSIKSANMGRTTRWHDDGDAVSAIEM